ncbi:MAG TPA: DUF4244 domain-containing protein [Bacillota bacterium]|nr:DUF4244 domain-containing protein [Bacillota bacterium]
MSDNCTTQHQTHGTDAERDERGMTTAEYAVGTVGAVTAAGTLIWIFQQDWFRELLMAIIKAIILLVTGLDV